MSQPGSIPSISSISNTPLANTDSRTVSMPGGQTVVFRPLATYKEFDQALSLQKLVWGGESSTGFSNVVLGVNNRIGGVSAGAFDSHGALVGVIISMVGLIDGEVAQWSFRLGIHPEYRNQGLGYQLKEFQRQTCARQGIKYIYWSYDPLVARNAYFNLVKLGAEVHEFVHEMYKGSDSPLHALLPTHRFIVKWDTATPTKRPVLTRQDVQNIPTLTEKDTDFDGDRFKVEIPRDILFLKEADQEKALWFSKHISVIMDRYFKTFTIENFMQDRTDLDRYYIFKRR